MRRIELKKFAEPVAGMPHYSAILKLVVNMPLNPQRGFDAEEMRRTLHILDKIDEADDAVMLEDAEWTLVKNKLSRFPFAIAHRDLLAFIDDVNEAPEISAQDQPVSREEAP